MNFMDDTDPWPNPMDALFPKIAKCEWTKYGFSGDMEVKAAQCQLPMNNITQWTFFVFWWWLLLVLIVNVVSFFHFILNIFPFYRRRSYQKLVAKVCRDDVEAVRTFTLELDGKKIKKRRKKRSCIKVDLTFGDWLVLHFIKKNLQDWQFREFVRRLSMTKNHVVQIKSKSSKQWYV